MWFINWIGLIGSYIALTIMMLFMVQGWFGYMIGSITLIITIGLIRMWINWPIEQYRPKQDVIKKPALYGRRRYH